jgi:hypothetical protein
LVLFLLTAFSAAFGGKKGPKLPETIDLPRRLMLTSSLQRSRGRNSVSKRNDDAVGRVGTNVFESLVKTEIVSGVPEAD